MAEDSERRPAANGAPSYESAAAPSVGVGYVLALAPILAAVTAAWNEESGDCADCGRNDRWSGWRRCMTCLREYRDGINRRHCAELRLPPVEVAA